LEKYGDVFNTGDSNIVKLDDPIRHPQYAKVTGILYRYPKDMNYNKYNFITVKLPKLTQVELAIFQEMIDHNIDIATFSETDTTSKSTTGSPFFLLGNYRLAVAPHY
jgi:hypothetical protein